MREVVNVNTQSIAEEVLAAEDDIPYEPKAPVLEVDYKVGKRYRIEGELAQGGQGTVYRASDIETGIAVALKIPRVKGREDLERAAREIVVASALSQESEGVVSFIDAGVAKDSGKPFVYIASELMPKGSLDQEVRTVPAGQFAFEGVKKALLPVLKGIKAVHEAGLVHRDIKPSNILLDVNGYGRLSDFGTVIAPDSESEKLVACHIDPEMVTDPSATTVKCMGTITFMPPEVLIDREAFTQAGDIFSLGMTAYWVMSGRHAWLDNGVRGVDYRENLYNYQATPLQVHNSRVPNEVGEFFTRACMAKNPKHRPADVEEILPYLEIL